MPSAQAVADQLEARGADITLVKVVGGTETRESVKARLFDVHDRLVDGVTILASDREAYIASLGLSETPSQTQHFVDEGDGTRRRIVRVGTHYFRGEVVAYTLRTRG